MDWELLGVMTELEARELTVGTALESTATGVRVRGTVSEVYQWSGVYTSGRPRSVVSAVVKWVDAPTMRRSIFSDNLPAGWENVRVV